MSNETKYGFTTRSEFSEFGESVEFKHDLKPLGHNPGHRTVGAVWLVILTALGLFWWAALTLIAGLIG